MAPLLVVTVINIVSVPLFTAISVLSSMRSVQRPDEFISAAARPCHFGCNGLVATTRNCFPKIGQATGRRR